VSSSFLVPHHCPLVHCPPPPPSPHHHHRHYAAVKSTKSPASAFSSSSALLALAAQNLLFRSLLQACKHRSKKDSRIFSSILASILAARYIQCRWETTLSTADDISTSFGGKNFQYRIDSPWRNMIVIGLSLWKSMEFLYDFIGLLLGHVTYLVYTRRCFNTFYRCATVGNQSYSYYRVGRLDSCAGMMSNIGICLRAKSQSDEETAKQILDQKITREEPPPGPPIWQLKEKPSWN